jgi:CheY-like chemotaxis protein
VSRLIVIDDGKEVAESIRRLGEAEGFEVRVAHDGESFKAAYEGFAPDAIVTDVLMPDMDGLEVLRYLAKRECQAGIIIVSGSDETLRGMAEKLGRARGLNIVASMAKPLRAADLRAKLASLKTAR